MSKAWGKSLIAFSAASYSLSGIIYIAVMYYYHNWNILLIINIFIIIILIIISYTIQKETPRFLLASKKFTEFEEVTRYISVFNGTELEYQKVLNEVRPLKEKYELHLMKKEDFGKNVRSNFITEVLLQYGVLFKTKDLSITTSKFIIYFISVNILYYGFFMNVEKLEGDIYFNLIIIFLGELISEIMAGALMHLLSSRTLLILMFTQCFSICLIFIYVDVSAFLSSILLFGFSFGFSMSFVVVFAYTNETFNPHIKATVFNFLMNAGNLAVAFMGPVIERFENPYSFYAIVSIVPVFVFFAFD